MNSKTLSDQALVDALQTEHPGQALVDEYYRRCIPLYLDFIGHYWHTGYYLHDQQSVGPEDQQRMIRHIADSISLDHRDRVLDVGCGIGSTACYLAQNYSTNVHGLTPVAEQQAIARQIIHQTATSDRVKIDLGHAAELPYPDQHFDAVLFFESPCHFPDRAAFFKEAWRVLKPGGWLAGEDWLATSNHHPQQIPDRLKDISRQWAMPIPGSGNSYIQAIEQAGFSDACYIDLQTQCHLDKGFATRPDQQRELHQEIQDCQNPLLKLTLQGLATLGRARADNLFTIGQFSALKGGPDIESRL